MSATLKDIADRLELSTSTVSRALNGKPGVSDKVRQAVLEVAQELNFTPNPSAQGLVSSKTYAVALVIQRQLFHPRNPFYDPIMMGVEEELDRHGYHMVVNFLDEEQLEKRIPSGLDTRRLDGLIITGCEFAPSTMMKLIALGLPTVLAANTFPLIKVDEVTSENREGAYVAAKHLIEHGHQQIAFLGGPQNWSPIAERAEGYSRAMYEHGFAPRLHFSSGVEIENGYNSLLTVRADYPETTAFVASNDAMAVGALKAARELNLDVPQDMAVIGYDDQFFAQSAEPPLTTVHIRKVEMGVLAVRRLLDLIEEESSIPVQMRISNELVIRRSCGCEG